LGYLGILSLGHGAFFSRSRLRDGHAPDAPDRRSRRGTATPSLADSWSSSDWQEAALFWHGFETRPWFALLMVGLAPGLLAFALGYLAFRSRVTGVYTVDHPPRGPDLRPDAGVLYRNEMGFGGNNG